MSDNTFFGSYERFSTVSKEEAAVLMNADNLVGDRFDIVFKTEDHRPVAWLKNRFGGEIGFLDAKASHKLSILAARGWKLNAVLSFVAYSDLPDPGAYWGEVALLCYEPSEAEVFDPFVASVGKSIMDNKRPLLSLNENEIRHVKENKGNWLPSGTVKLPKLKKGSAFIKTERSLTEKMVEQGRKGNKGCYVISWAFIICVVVAVILLLKSCLSL